MADLAGEKALLALAVVALALAVVLAAAAVFDL